MMFSEQRTSKIQNIPLRVISPEKSQIEPERTAEQPWIKVKTGRLIDGYVIELKYVWMNAFVSLTPFAERPFMIPLRRPALTFLFLRF